MTYMSVERPTIQDAFCAAHKAAASAATAADRRKFRDIARLIWQACGEQTPDPILALTLTPDEATAKRGQA